MSEYGPVDPEKGAPQGMPFQSAKYYCLLSGLLESELDEFLSLLYYMCKEEIDQPDGKVYRKDGMMIPHITMADDAIRRIKCQRTR